MVKQAHQKLTPAEQAEIQAKIQRTQLVCIKVLSALERHFPEGYVLTLVARARRSPCDDDMLISAETELAPLLACIKGIGKRFKDEKTPFLDATGKRHPRPKKGKCGDGP
ncbi:MAG: hypothetical protein U0836_16140 [Pirellulales bacterium]